MKKIILNITLLCSLSLSVYSQFDCTPTYTTAGPNVYTCKGGTIYTFVPSCEYSDPDRAKITSDLLKVYGVQIYGPNGIEESDILAPPSALYNCHAYAWHLTEGNMNKVWIEGVVNGSNYNNLSMYWDNIYGCFEERDDTDFDKILGSRLVKFVFLVH